jgi:hypothetical protein
MSRAVRSIVDGLLLVWVSLGPLCWILRDGLGPNSIETHGWRAVSGFLLTFWWGPICASLVLLSFALRKQGLRK